MRYCLIVNPYSRHGKGRILADRCVRELARLGCSFETKTVREFQEGYTLSREANRRGFDVIVALGGDGTINRVINGFYDRDGRRISAARFGVVHTGTSPDLCLSYGIPCTPEEAVRRLVEGRFRSIPVGRIRCARGWHPGNAGKRIAELQDSAVAYFACCANIGLGAALARKANGASRRYLGDVPGTFVSLLQVLARYRPGRYDAALDGNPVCLEKVVNVSVGLTKYIASGIKSPAGNMDGRDRFYVMTVRGITILNLGSMLARVYRGRACADTDYLSVSEAGTVEIPGSDMNNEVEYDGDPGGFLPCVIDLAPDRLELIG